MEHIIVVRLNENQKLRAIGKMIKLRGTHFIERCISTATKSLSLRKVSLSTRLLCIVRIITHLFFLLSMGMSFTIICCRAIFLNQNPFQFKIG